LPLIVEVLFATSQTRTGDNGGKHKTKAREDKFSSFPNLSLRLVGPTRYFSNYNFSDLQVLCERLEQLDIEAIMEADNVQVEKVLQ
jgi:hypothetical protein